LLNDKHDASSLQRPVQMDMERRNTKLVAGIEHVCARDYHHDVDHNHELDNFKLNHHEFVDNIQFNHDVKLDDDYHGRWHDHLDKLHNHDDARTLFLRMAAILWFDRRRMHLHELHRRPKRATDQLHDDVDDNHGRSVRQFVCFQMHAQWLDQS